MVSVLLGTAIVAAPTAVEAAEPKPVVTVSPGFIPDDENPQWWPQTVEQPQRVWATGLPANATVYLQQCEANPPAGDFYHVAGVEVGGPIRCEEFGGYPDYATFTWVSVPVPYQVDGDGVLDSVVRETWNGPPLLEFGLGTTWNLDGISLLADKGDCTRATQPVCWLNIVNSAGEVLASTIVKTACYSDPPIAALTVTPQGGEVPLDVVADASGSDGQGLCPAPIESYTFQFDDITVVEPDDGTVEPPVVVGPQASPTASHTFTRPDHTYRVRVTVKNTAGQTSSASVTVTTAAADRDGDGISDNDDNCPGAPNPLQEDADGDLTGDACDPDTDGDGLDNGDDPCPLDATNACADPDPDPDPDPVCDAKYTSSQVEAWSGYSSEFWLDVGLRWCTDGQAVRVDASSAVNPDLFIDDSTFMQRALDELIFIDFRAAGAPEVTISALGNGVVNVAVSPHVRACVDSGDFLLSAGTLGVGRGINAAWKRLPVRVRERFAQVWTRTVFRTGRTIVDGAITRVVDDPMARTTALTLSRELFASLDLLVSDIVEEGFSSALEGMEDICVTTWKGDLNLTLYPNGVVVDRWVKTDGASWSLEQRTETSG